MMTAVYRLFLFALAGAIVYLFCTRLASRQLTRALAVGGLALIAFLLIVPNAANRVAGVFGVTRGADFFFYVAHLFALFALMVLYVRFRNVNEKLSRIVREQALRSAGVPPHPP